VKTTGGRPKKLKNGGIKCQKNGHGWGTEILRILGKTTKRSEDRQEKAWKADTWSERETQADRRSGIWGHTLKVGTRKKLDDQGMGCEKGSSRSGGGQRAKAGMASQSKTLTEVALGQAEGRRGEGQDNDDILGETRIKPEGGLRVEDWRGDFTNKNQTTKSNMKDKGNQRIKGIGSRAAPLGPPKTRNSRGVLSLEGNLGRGRGQLGKRAIRFWEFLLVDEVRRLPRSQPC